MGLSTKASQKLIDDLGLNWSPRQRDKYLANIKVVDLPRLSQEYPPNECFMVETPETTKQWEENWKDQLERPELDFCVPYEVLNLDYTRMRHIIQQDESVIFRDLDSKEIVLVVLRDFVPDEDLRKKMEGVCQKASSHFVCTGRPGPGSICYFGYDCGISSEHHMKLLGERQRLEKDGESTPEMERDNEAQGMAGIVWNLMKSKFPPEITADFNDTIRKCDLPRMDKMKDDESFTFEVGGEAVTFETGENGLELPPPSAEAIVNYASITERKDWFANSFVASYTATAPDDHTKGGNFYLASYGILVLAASNTATAWRYLDFHGTTLYEVKPEPDERPGNEARKDGGLNTGFSFDIAIGLRVLRKECPLIVERRRGRVTKATSPKAGLPETQATAPLYQYGLRPRTSIPNYYESELEPFTDTESTAVGSGEFGLKSEYQTETETDWTETETETETETRVGSGSLTGPQSEFSPIYQAYGTVSNLPKLS
ncbi:uncharacterized protein F4812DRAFT_362544 [Daldinia caldariorum]|uniref:uncharacterized protein n=1 Tax=Daldinia caldariorum TaxID=326644 RepID=UPI00200896F4|nr:uncharacterized protein F4812DRAFT_362544 [Daldinia caldariorum]KAI1468320.1 hypothetical protein F4812DRAFT_362544 [Daldinia caldariorum]